MNIKKRNILVSYFKIHCNRLTKVRKDLREKKKLRILRKMYTSLRFLYVYYLIKYKKDEKIIITGCGRSATQYTSRIFNQLGVKIGHERLEKNGIISWYLVPDTNSSVWGPSYCSVKNAEMPVVHQIRHPLDVIPSVMKVFSDQREWYFIEKFIPLENHEPIMVKAMKYWYYWNILAEKKSIHSYRVENIENEIDTLISIGKFKVTNDMNFVFKNISKKTHTRNHTKMNWNDLRTCDSLFTEKIMELSERYGYFDSP